MKHKSAISTCPCYYTYSTRDFTYWNIFLSQKIDLHIYTFDHFHTLNLLLQPHPTVKI